MRKNVGLAMTLAIIAPIGMASPFHDAFAYQAPRPPIAGDCNQIAAAIGPDATWYGEIAGRRWDNFQDQYYPFSARGCFHSERECRIWHNQALTYMDRGPMNYAICRRGLR